jgi:putative salt-induced outer membrane protein YdiY
MKLTTLLLVSALAWPLLADQVTLKNGDRLSGRIVTSDDKTIVLKTDYAGEVKIDRAQVTAITTDQPLNVTLKDKGKVLGVVQAKDDAVEVKTATGEVLKTTPAAVEALRDDASQRAWERAYERAHHARLTDFWSGLASIGMASSSGNSSTTAFNTTAAATRVAGKNKIGLNFNQIYATQSTTLPHGATANRVSGAVRLDRDVSPKLFVYGVNAYDYDKFLDLDLRLVAGGGFGYHAWKSKRGFLDLSGGGNWNREQFGADSANLLRNSGELAVNEEWNYQPLSRLKLAQRVSFYPNMTQTGEYRLSFDSSASVPIMKWLEWNLGFNDRYLSNPVAGKVKNDSVFTMGIRVSFDQSKR